MAKKRKTPEPVFPEDAPVLSAADVTFGGRTRDDSAKDLGQWADDAFDADAVFTPARDAFLAKLVEVLSERTGKTYDCLFTFLERNERSRAVDAAAMARAWNEALHRLGYAVKAGARKC